MTISHPAYLHTYRSAYGAGLPSPPPIFQDPEFNRNLQFGIIDNGLLVAMTLAGLSLEDQIAKVVGVRGYGAIMGATIGNAISDGVAAIPQGWKASAGVTTGALLPVLPFLVAMGLRREIKGATRNALVASSLVLLGWAFLGKGVRQKAGEQPGKTS